MRRVRKNSYKKRSLPWELLCHNENYQDLGNWALYCLWWYLTCSLSTHFQEWLPWMKVLVLWLLSMPWKQSFVNFSIKPKLCNFCKTSFYNFHLARMLEPNCYAWIKDFWMHSIWRDVLWVRVHDLKVPILFIWSCVNIDLMPNGEWHKHWDFLALKQ